MIRSLLIYEGSGFDPYRNLAVEQYLLESVQEGQCILYLWQNENTVVIGRNQNPWKECRTELLEAEGGRLARRLSGGGAVFHDLGNLNFTFLMSQSDYDEGTQLTVIQEALLQLGIPTERSGRNDLLAGGRKFSGSAYYKNGRQAYHHGTLLVDADLDKLSRYLSPSKAKLQSKGVVSVRSRVGNLKELNPDISVSGLKEALKEAFSKVYRLPVQELEGVGSDAIRAMTQRNQSWDWNFGQKLPFTWEWEQRFPWGCLHIQLNVQHGIIQQARVYTDAMDDRLAPELETKLIGLPFDPQYLETMIPK